MSFEEFFKRFLAILFVLLLWAGIWAARSTLLLGFAAALLAIGISIPAGWLQRIRWRRAWANGVATLLIGIIALVLVLSILPRLLVELVSLLSSIPAAVQELWVGYEDIRRSSTFLEAALPDLPAISANEIAPEDAQAIMNQLINASLAIAPSLFGGVNVLVAIIVNLIFVIFIAIFFLIDPNSYTKASLYLVPARYHDRMLAIWHELYLTIKHWITALSLSIAITVVLVWLILGVILGMPNAVIVAVFAGLATFIPNIGVFLPLIPIVIFTLSSDNPAQLAIMAPVYLLIQLLESNVITPSIVKAELNIPAGALMLFQLLVTFAFGALGLLLAVPMFAILIVLVREVYSFDMLGLREMQTDIPALVDGVGEIEEAKTGAVEGDMSSDSSSRAIVLETSTTIESTED